MTGVMLDMSEYDRVEMDWLRCRTVLCRFSQVRPFSSFVSHLLFTDSRIVRTAPRWQGAGTRQPVRGSPTDSDLNLDPPILLATPSPPSHSSSATLGDSAASNLLVKLSSGIGGMLTGLGLGNVGSTTDSKGTPMEDEEKRLMDQGYQSPLGKSAAPLRLSPSRQNDLLPPSPPRPNSSLRGRSSPNEFGREGIEDGRRLAERKERGMTNSSFGTLGQSVFYFISRNRLYADARSAKTNLESSQLKLNLRPLNGLLLLRRPLSIQLRISNPLPRRSFTPYPLDPIPQQIDFGPEF